MIKKSVKKRFKSTKKKLLRRPGGQSHSLAKKPRRLKKIKKKLNPISPGLLKKIQNYANT